MNIKSLQQYIESVNLGKKEYLFIKKFCFDNEIDIIDFFKLGNNYNYPFLKNFFIQALSKSIQDEEIISYFLNKQNDLPEINFKNILEKYNVSLTYNHLLGITKEEELLLLIKENAYNKIFNFIKENSEFKKHEKIKQLIITDFTFIEKFEKSNINFNQQSYNSLDISLNNILGTKEENPNLIKVDKFYKFIDKNKNKIDFHQRKKYLNLIINYGALTVHDFKKLGYWDYVFIPLIHEKEYPGITKEHNFFNDVIKYKEQIFSETEPYGTIKLNTDLSAKDKIKLVVEYIKNYVVESYNYTTWAIFTHFLPEVNETFINDFFKLGIESGYIFTNGLKEEYIQPYKRHTHDKSIEYYSKSLDNDIIRGHKELIAKQILRHKYMFKDNKVLNNYIPLSKDIVEKDKFILSLNNEELNSLIIALKENNLPNTASKVMTMRLEDKLPEKKIKTKQPKI